MSISIDSMTFLIAYVVPGLVAMLGFRHFSPTINGWIGASEREKPKLGGAALLIAMALGAGLMADALRAHTIDWVHHRTGIDQPEWSYAALDESKFDQFEGIVDNHFRYHQFYGNSVICILFWYWASLISNRSRSLAFHGITVLVLVVAWMGSRSDLDACYAAIGELLSTPLE